MYYDTLKINDISKHDLDKIRMIAEQNEINFRYFENAIGISLDETTQISDIEDIMSVFSEWRGEFAHLQTEKLSIDWNTSLIRKSDFMTHEIFNRFNSEHEMLRYMKALENKDLSLTHSMISLGSCTMKLNATSEMIPITWPEFNAIHPFVPKNQVYGYYEVLEELSRDLIEITGFDGISLQPNSGAQGEYAGLMTIMAYLHDIGEGHRDVALIPSSAHGTNPASAVLAGMKVVVVKCLDNGYIDIDDLRSKAEQHQNDLACLMVTYPSTNGVYEEGIKEITEIIHQNGGQVYMDGANMNAQVGLTNPGMIGADVCHLNLHKTFCIPHGGGGPGMGPICTAKHLTPYLPGHAVVDISSNKAMGAVSAAPFGSPSILLISYAYIKMMGSGGLKEATKIAILNANYMMKKLGSAYQELYKGANGTVAHEMIIDPRPFKISAGVQVEDIAKRLMDYGFHAPTVSFPIPGTLMIEPTESEPKDEMDRFCQAMISIREEIGRIESGEWSREDNPLVNAPHTSDMATASEWNHQYTREEAVFPLHWVKQHKFWPSVARVDNSYGDRNLVCACLPTEAYIEMPS